MCWAGEGGAKTPRESGSLTGMAGVWGQSRGVPGRLESQERPGSRALRARGGTWACSLPNPQDGPPFTHSCTGTPLGTGLQGGETRFLQGGAELSVPHPCLSALRVRPPCPYNPSHASVSSSPPG